MYNTRTVLSAGKIHSAMTSCVSWRHDCIYLTLVVATNGAQCCWNAGRYEKNSFAFRFIFCHFTSKRARARERERETLPSKLKAMMKWMSIFKHWAILGINSTTKRSRSFKLQNSHNCHLVWGGKTWHLLFLWIITEITGRFSFCLTDQIKPWFKGISFGVCQILCKFEVCWQQPGSVECRSTTLIRRGR